MTPVLFNVYAERLIERVLMENKGIVIGGEWIITIIYAYDQAVVAASDEELQSTMDNICQES